MTMLTKSTETFISSFEWIMTRNLMVAIIEQFGSERDFLIEREEVPFTRGGLATFKGWDNTADLMAFYSAHKQDINSYANAVYEMDCFKSVDAMLKDEALLPDDYDATPKRNGQMAGVLGLLFPIIEPEPVTEQMACALALLVGRKFLYAYSEWNEYEQDRIDTLTKEQAPKYDGMENEIIRACDIVRL